MKNKNGKYRNNQKNKNKQNKQKSKNKSDNQLFYKLVACIIIVILLGVFAGSKFAIRVLFLGGISYIFSRLSKHYNDNVE